MKIWSDDFQNGGELGKKFSCEGEGVCPSLAWSEIPQGAKSLAVSVVDPDAPGGNFIHWLAVNIPISRTETGSGEAVGLELINSGGGKEYVPACPPTGKHRYIFTIYALNIEELKIDTSADFFASIGSYTIEKTEIMATYQKSQL